MRNRVAANLIFFGVCLAGYIALGGVPHELLPETSSPAVVVRVVLPGAEAEVVESRVLLLLEEALRGIEGVRETTGLAVDEAAALTLVLEAGADIRRIGDRVRERVGSLTTLPAEAEDPVVSEIAENREIFRIAVHGVAGERDLHEAARRVQDAVAAVRGVSSVERLTGWDRELTIEIPEENLTRFGLTFDRVAAAVRSGSAEIPAGTARSGSHELSLRTEGAAINAEDFGRIPLIAVPGGGTARLAEVGIVTDGLDAADREAWMDGEPAVFLTVSLRESGRLAETTERAREVIRGIQLPEGIQATPWYFASEDFQDRLDLMIRNGISGLGLIFLVLFFTLSTRLAVWTAAGLPFTLLRRLPVDALARGHGEPDQHVRVHHGPRHRGGRCDRGRRKRSATDGGRRRERGRGSYSGHPAGLLPGGVRRADHDGRVCPAPWNSGRLRRTDRRRAAHGASHFGVLPPGSRPDPPASPGARRLGRASEPPTRPDPRHGPVGFRLDRGDGLPASAAVGAQ